MLERRGDYVAALTGYVAPTARVWANPLTRAGWNAPGGMPMKYILLLVPCVLALLTQLYNRIDPALFGVPFFYWYLMLLVPVSSLFIYLAWKVESR